MRITAIIMQTIRIRFIGNEIKSANLINMLHDIDGVAQIEEMPAMDSCCQKAVPSRSAAGKSSPCICNIEVAVMNGNAADRIRIFTAGAAMLMDSAAEFVDRF